MSKFPKCCVYTVLYGTADCLQEYPQDIRETMDFIAFVDDPTITSETWKLRQLRPRFPADLPRSSRWVKLQPHLLLPEYDASLYVDCTVDLLVPPQTLFQDLLFGQTDTMALIRHSMHEGLEREVAAILSLDLDSPARMLSQFQAYASTGFQASETLIWCGIMLRWHHHPEVIALMQSWLEHVLLYSRRDQLSLPYLLQHSAADPVLHPIDNRASRYHRWPSSLTRQRADWRQQPVEPSSPAMQQIVEALQDRLKEDDLQQTAPLRQALQACEGENIQLRATVERQCADHALLETRLADSERLSGERDRLLAGFRAALETMRQSTSWRLTAPLRGLAQAVGSLRTKVRPTGFNAAPPRYGQGQQ